MAVISNSAQGIGQPIRGTCLTSLGSTGIVAVYWDGSKASSHDIIVPEFGTHLQLTAFAKATVVGTPVSFSPTVWAKVPAESKNPSRNWPVDLDSAFGMGPNGTEIWIKLKTSTSLDNYTSFTTGGVKVSESMQVPLYGAQEVRVVTTFSTADYCIMARFVD